MICWGRNVGVVSINHDLVVDECDVLFVVDVETGLSDGAVTLFGLVFVSLNQSSLFSKAIFDF